MANSSKAEYVFAPIKRDKVFKIVAAGEDKKSLMIDLLNCLIPDLNVHDIQYNDKEDPGLSLYDKSCIFDALCTTEQNKQCIIEVQAYDIDTYPDRMISYAASLVKRQMAAKKAAMSEMTPQEREEARKDYQLCPIYVVSILTGKLAWSVKYMQEVKARPESFNEEMMVKLYRNSEIANMTEQQQELVFSEFEEELRRSAELATAERKANTKVAKKMLEKGFDLGTIAECTGLSEEAIVALK